VPVTIKDCLDVAGLPATRGSKVFANNFPAADATAVRRLKETGAIVLGKTNAAEFGLWWETDNLVYGRTVNPWNPDCIAGGSSGGDAAAVAAGLSAIGLGSDLAGSIRVPSHFCGTVGLKATHGAISTFGHWPLHAPRYWHVGPIARSVEDVALAFDVLAGGDPNDPYCVGLPADGADVPPTASTLRIGWIRDGGSSPVRTDIGEAVAAAAQAFADLGCEVEEISIPALSEQNWNELSRILMGIEGSVIVGRSVAGREDQLHPFIRNRLTVRDVPLVDYIDALEVSEELRRQMATFFLRFDILIAPVCSAVAFEHGRSEVKIDDTLVDARHILRAAVPWDITGHPVLAVPFAMTTDGMPIGVQLIGRKFEERLICKVGLTLQAASSVAGKHPPCAWAENRQALGS
jgi:aspartyl-tRNA(Asn)/glutamyl-tRNA(Gln) amidotransferase subunit A